MSAARRDELAAQLRQITGWTELRFADDGQLRFGHALDGGSATARALLGEATAAGASLIVLEDASDRADVVFCRVVPGRWTHGDNDGRPPAHVVMIDFADFARVGGDRAARAAFNVGWSVLHEIEHVAHDSEDAARPGAVGACEQLINQMRRECGLAVRAEYFYTPLPGTERGDFKTRFMRLAFEREEVSGKGGKRFWLVWDASVVGEADDAHQLAHR